MSQKPNTGRMTAYNGVFEIKCTMPNGVIRTVTGRTREVTTESKPVGYTHGLNDDFHSMRVTHKVVLDVVGSMQIEDRYPQCGTKKCKNTVFFLVKFPDSKTDVYMCRDCIVRRVQGKDGVVIRTVSNSATNHLIASENRAMHSRTSTSP